MHVRPKSGDVPDEREARLVILGPEFPHSKGEKESPARSEAQKILDNRGNSPRNYKNTLVFLAGDTIRMKELKNAIRHYLAWRSIEVIRLGLPASRRLREAVVAGPYHPAFGFLVQSYRFHRHIDEKVGACAPVKGEAVEIYIAPRSLPLLMGDRRQAWERLHARWPGKVITYHLDPTFTGGQIKVVTSPLS